MKRRSSAVRLAVAVSAAALLLSAGASSAWAQTEDHPPPPPGYSPLIPDAPHDLHESTSLDKGFFTLKLGLAPIYDYTWLSQDEESIRQVDIQENAGQWRSGRIQARGTLFATSAHPWKYLVSFEYRGFDSDPDQTWSWTDWSLTIPAGPLGELSLGKIKESFDYEMVGDAANLPHLERLLSPFFTSRSIGFRVNKSLLDERATVAAGAFNDWFVKDLSYDDSGWDFTGRVTAVPLWRNDGRRFLHLGGGFRHVQADEGVVRYRGRPESNVTDYYVDTGTIVASDANHWSAEALWNEGPFSLLAEYNEAQVSSVEANDPQFRGYYATLSWFPTGTHRPYDRKVGYARRPLPHGRYGEIELVARYGIVDGVDKGIDGGYLKKWFAGVTWWATRRWRFSLGYGQAFLDKDGVEGKTNQTLARVQWIY